MANMKSQQMFTDEGALCIFEDFQRDTGLLKYNSNSKTRDKEFASAVHTGSNRLRAGDDDEEEWDNSDIEESEEEETPTRKKFKVRAKMKDGKETVLSVEDFFKSVKNGAEYLEILGERALGYEAALAKAKASGQIALLDALKKSALLFRMEAQLHSQGVTKFLSEKTVATLAQKSDKNIRLDWLANFARVIPDSIIASKNKLDTLCIFDNYVIMHYDPENTGAKETEEEITRRKDPIMFGVIDGKRRLYYVGDWIDEYCNLTLEEIVKMIGEEHIQNTKDFKP